jgi:hypothetical protein
VQRDVAIPNQIEIRLPRRLEFSLVSRILGSFCRPVEQDCVQSLEIVVQILDGTLMQLRGTGY